MAFYRRDAKRGHGERETPGGRAKIPVSLRLSIAPLNFFQLPLAAFEEQSTGDG